jgi:hypothetical protein
MMTDASRVIAVALVLVVWGWPAPRAAGDPPRSGPGSEKRFPPLKVPPGFKATLFACDPMVEYPSAIAAGPRSGAIFVAIDYVSGLGAEIVRRDEVRLAEDVDGDGYADRASVYAAGFNSIQGLAFRDGTLYVMHAPFLSAVGDRDGDGVAEDRRDLLTGLGLPPEKNPSRLPVPTGLSSATTAGSTWPSATTAATSRARRGIVWCTTAAASCGAGRTGATCTSSPPVCGTSTTSRWTRS